MLTAAVISAFADELQKIAGVPIPIGKVLGPQGVAMAAQRRATAAATPRVYTPQEKHELGRRLFGTEAANKVSPLPPPPPSQRVPPPPPRVQAPDQSGIRMPVGEFLGGLSAQQRAAIGR
jgi:hypothetical protein